MAVPVLGFAGSASADASIQVSVGAAHLLAKGGAVSVDLTVVCDPSLILYSGDVRLSQDAGGHKLAQGTASFYSDTGIPCTGSPQVIHMTVFPAPVWSFKLGVAVLSADASAVDPNTYTYANATVGPLQVRITK
jgi:hypothetical protein